MYTSKLIFGLAAIASTTVNALVTPGMSLDKRHSFNAGGDCSPQPLGSGPSVTPDTDNAFINSTVLSDIAVQAVTPAGWAVVYQDLQAASTDSGYIAYEEITSYDPGYCASQCCNFWTNCTSFNIYFERDPVIDPGANCTNPGSTTRIKCSFWSADLTQGDATNDGQYCQDFHVVIAGSNAYKGGCAKPSTSSSTTAASTSTTVSTISSTTSSAVITTTPKSSSTLTTTAKSSSTTTTTTSTKAPVTTTPASNWFSWPVPAPPAPPVKPAAPTPPAPPAPPAAPGKPAPPAAPAPPKGPPAVPAVPAPLKGWTSTHD